MNHNHSIPLLAISVAICGSGLLHAGTLRSQESGDQQLDTSPGKHEGCMVGQTEVIYYIPRHFDPSTAQYLVLIHGAGHRHRPGALTHIDEWRHIADIENLVLIAPVFDRIYKPSMIGEIIQDEFLWDFVYLLNNRNEHRSDKKLLEIFSFFKRHLVARDKFHLYGHSGGGQFVNRFITFHPERIDKVAISASGSFVFPRFDQEYPFGLNTTHLEERFGRHIQADDLKLTEDQYDKRMTTLLGLKLFVIAGQEDETILNDGEDWQGRTVPERAWNYFNAMKKLNGDMKRRGFRSEQAPFRLQLALLPKVGHDHEAGSAAAQQRLFPPEPRTKGMVLRLDFDGGLWDKSGHKNMISSVASPGIGAGFAAFSAKGKRHVNAALGQDSDLLGCTEMTIKVRVRMSRQIRSHPFARIIQTSGNQWKGSCLMVNDNRQVVGWIQTASATRTPNMFNKLPIKGRSPELLSKVPLDDGQWHNIIMTYDGEVVRLFVDDQLQSQTRWEGGIIHFHQLNIGYVESNGFHFDGDMDDLEIHGRCILPTASNN